MKEIPDRSLEGQTMSGPHVAPGLSRALAIAGRARYYAGRISEGKEITLRVLTGICPGEVLSADRACSHSLVSM